VANTLWLLLTTTASVCAISVRPGAPGASQFMAQSRAAVRCWPVAQEAADGAEGAPAPSPAPPSSDGDDLLSSAAFLKQKLKVLQKELDEVAVETENVNAQVEAQREEFAQQRTRLQTDFDNFRARHFNATMDAQVDARIKLLSEFLAVLDNFDRARASIKPEGEAAEALNGDYQNMHATLMTALTALDVTQIETVGKEFDYNLHMAIQQVPSDEYDEGVVCAELQPGYLCKEKLLRAAYVMVSS